MKEILRQLIMKADAFLDGAVECEDTRNLQNALEELQETFLTEGDNETSQYLWRAIANLSEALSNFTR